jgi:hypothetical protein
MGLGGDINRWSYLKSRLKISGTISPHPSCAEVRLYYYYYYYYYYYWIMIFNLLFSNCAICMYLCIVYSTVFSATGHFFHKWNWSEQSYLQYSLRKKIISQIPVLTITMLFMLLFSSPSFIKTFLCVLVYCLYLVYFSYVPVLSLLLALRLLCQHIKHKE